MKKYVLSLIILAFCGIALAQTMKNDAYPKIEPFMQFWAKLQNKIATEKVDLRPNYDIRIQSNFSNKKVSKGSLKFKINESSTELLDLLKDFMNAVDDSNLLKVIALDNLQEDINNADLQIKFDDADVNFKLILSANSDSTAQNVASRFRIVFALTTQFVQNAPEEDFYKNAIITAEKEQITVTGKISRTNFEQFLKNL